MLKAFVPPHWSKAIQRIAAALKQYVPPDVTIVESPHDADLVVIHVIGRRNQIQTEIDWALERGQRYAMAQYVLRSTQKPNTAEWLGIWQQAALVWSYYDLPALCVEDGGAYTGTNFYHAPLGVHRSTFYDRRKLNGTRPFVAMTHGTSWLCEGVREATIAARDVGRPVWHLGPHVRKADGMLAEHDVTDDKLATRYSECDYVCALRRTEGFELPAAEGLLCGARPVLYDRPHYRHWYGDFAEYIPEGDRPHVVDALRALFRRPIRRVSEVEQMAAAALFHWPTIAEGFWAQCLTRL